MNGLWVIPILKHVRYMLLEDVLEADNFKSLVWKLLNQCEIAMIMRDLLSITHADQAWLIYSNGAIQIWRNNVLRSFWTRFLPLIYHHVRDYYKIRRFGPPPCYVT